MIIWLLIRITPKIKLSLLMNRKVMVSSQTSGRYPYGLSPCSGVGHQNSNSTTIHLSIIQINTTCAWEFAFTSGCRRIFLTSSAVSPSRHHQVFGSCSLLQIRVYRSSALTSGVPVDSFLVLCKERKCCYFKKEGWRRYHINASSTPPALMRIKI